LEIIAGTPPGGGQDRAARTIAGLLGTEVTVSNVPGRGGGNAWDRLVARSGATGLVAVSSPTLITNAIVGESAIDHRDLTSLALLYTEHSALVVRPGSRLAEPSALFEALAQGSAVVSFATALGNVNHLLLAEIVAHLGADITALPLRVFESAPHAVDDVLADDGDVAVVSAASAIPGLRRGALVAVVVAAPERLGGLFAEVPTCTELAVPCARGTWRGLIGPPGLEASVVGAWAGRLGALVATEPWRALLEENLWVDSYLGPEPTWRFMESEREQLGILLEQMGLVAKVGDG
jgi:putative tricarboxylic transport membrane protein